jgi:hypothetical protein
MTPTPLMFDLKCWVGVAPTFFFLQNSRGGPYLSFFIYIRKRICTVYKASGKKKPRL